MRRIKRAKPSPALLVAVVALVAALAGTAIGGVAVTSLSKKDKKQVTKIAKKQGKKQANKQIDKKAPGLSVASATNAGNAGNADTVNDLSVQRLFAQVGTNGATKTLLNAGGLRITLGCPGGQLDIDGISQVNNSRILVRGVTGAEFGGVDFDSGASLNLGGSATFGHMFDLVFTQPNGTTVNGRLIVDKPPAYGFAGCTVSGVVTVG